MPYQHVNKTGHGRYDGRYGSKYYHYFSILSIIYALHHFSPQINTKNNIREWEDLAEEWVAWIWTHS